MNRNSQFILVFIVILGMSHGAFSQDSIGVGAQNSSWKWQTQLQDISIHLGDDTLSAAPEVEGADRKQWWEVFGYPTLNSLIELALEENQNVKIGKSQVAEGRERVKLARSYYYPSISLNPSFIREELSANRPMPFDIAVERVTMNSYLLPLDVSYEVDILGRIKNDVEASEFNFQATHASQEALQLAIASEVARNFALLLTLDTENQILARTIRSRQENLEIVETRYSAGLTNEIDLQRARTELSSVAVQLENNRRQRTEVELRLATLSGQPASTFSIEWTGIQYLAPVIQPDAPNALSANRPDIRAADYTIEAYKKQVESARKNRYPSLYLQGSAGLLTGESDQLFEGDSRNWLVGATLSVPLFEGGRRQAQLAISDHQLQAATYHLKQQELVAHQEVEQALSSLLRLHEQLAAQQEFLVAAQKAAELSQQRYRKGLVTYLEVVDAERIVLEAERLSAQLLGQQLISTIDLIVAMGGNLEEI